MKSEDIIAKYGDINLGDLPPPEKLDALMDDLVCCDDFNAQHRRILTQGYMLGVLTVLSYKAQGREFSEVTSRLAQFMLATKLREEMNE